jgi:hypothetical protein
MKTNGLTPVSRLFPCEGTTMSGKVKSLYGVYKALGRDAFLAAARSYSDHVHETVEDTLREMETRWYDASHTVTEAEIMMDAYREGLITSSEFADTQESTDLDIKM